jgi:hypothetical protein
LRGIEDFAGHRAELHVLEVLFGVVPAAVHVFEGTPRWRSLESECRQRRFV